MTDPLSPSATMHEQRRAFVTYLYGLGAALDDPNDTRESAARRTLAVLRRSFAGRRQEIEAYDIVFEHDPPRSEQQVWLLLAGLFALHPHRRQPSGQCSLAWALGLLAHDRGDSIRRRFVQLISVDAAGLPHYARQAVQLVRANGIPLDYNQLLDDLCDLLAERARPEQAQRVRLDWTRAFHRAQKTRTAHGPNDTTPELITTETSVDH